MKTELGSEEYLLDVQKHLDNLLATLHVVNEKLPNSKDDLRMAFSMMVWPIVESGHSLLFLSSGHKLRDSYILARPIFEHVLNMGYFGAKGNSVIRKALNHTQQKSYRDLSREITIKDIKIAVGLKNIEDYPVTDDLRKSIEEFTNKKGFEERSWTGDNIFKKIELISDKYSKEIGLILTANLYFIYRHSSEIIHGTLFGVSFSMGLTRISHEWSKNDDDYRKFVNTRISLIIVNVMLLTYCALEIIHYHYPIPDEIIKAKKIVYDFHDKT